MILFVDTSALIKLYIAEPGSQAMQLKVPGKLLAASYLTYAEAHATFARLRREDLLVELGTPSESCWTWFADGSFLTHSGTSLGAGYVGGTAARAWAAQKWRGQTPTPMAVKKEILESVRWLPDLSNCCGSGTCGSLDVSRALGGSVMCVVPSAPSGSYCQ